MRSRKFYPQRVGKVLVALIAHRGGAGNVTRYARDNIRDENHQEGREVMVP